MNAPATVESQRRCDDELLPLNFSWLHIGAGKVYSSTKYWKWVNHGGRAKV